MKNHTMRPAKLQLSKATLRNLSPETLAEAAGGGSSWPYPTMTCASACRRCGNTAGDLCIIDPTL
jgi:hypothetical protein